MFFKEVDMSPEEIFAHNVKSCREAKDLTQRELAVEILGYPEELLRKVEEGNTAECSISFYVNIAKFFEVSVDDLFTNRHLSYQISCD